MPKNPIRTEVTIPTLLGFSLLILGLPSCQEQVEEIAQIVSTEVAEGVTIESITHHETTWQVVTVDPAQSKLSIRLSDSNGEPLRNFSRFQKAAQAAGETTVWMMNAGMYHLGGTPVGLCIIDGQEVSPVNDSEGEGNFFLKPNGIFFCNAEGARIIATDEWPFYSAGPIDDATQSGPLLVQKSKLHSAIRENSPNKHLRNGVGIRTDGHLCFVISTSPVTFHEMAVFLRDRLHCPDALYLDGAVSALYAPKVGLTPEATGLGPVIGLWEAEDETDP